MAHRCPICGASLPTDPRPETFPFCSARCRMVDLGNWLDGAYRVPAEEETVFSDELDGGEPTDSPIPLRRPPH